MSRERKTGRINRREFLRNGAAAGAGAGATALVGLSTRDAEAQVPRWHREADVVVVGSGAAGMPAAIRVRDLKASVIVVEENFDIGGHGIISQGSVALGGGTALQKKYGIDDSADQVYLENTRPDHVHTRYNDRAGVRAFADHNVEVFDFLVANGIAFVDAKPANVPAEGVVTPRRSTARPWSQDLKETINGTAGSGLMRPLEKSARAKGVEILLQHRMTRIVREHGTSGRVLGIATTNLKDNSVLNIRARQGVIACTGGSSSNLVIRTIYDPRLTEEYQVGCEPYSRQSGDAEQQGMAIGASLGSTSNMRTESYLAAHQADLDRLSVRVRPLEAGRPVLRPGGRVGHLGRGLPGRDPRQHARHALLRRDRHDSVSRSGDPTPYSTTWRRPCRAPSSR